MAKHVYTLLLFILFATDCSSYNIVPARKQSNALEGQFIRAMKQNMKGINQPLRTRKLPGTLLPNPAEHNVDGCETWPCNPLDDQCYNEVSCGPCVEDEDDPGFYVCTDLVDPPPPTCLEEPCGEDPHHCIDIGCGECDTATGKCTLLPHDCDQEFCNEKVDTCEEDGCGDCDFGTTSCTAPP